MQPTERAEAAVAEQPGAAPNFAQDERDLDSFGLEGVEEARRRCEAFRKIFARLRAEVGKSLVGQREVVDLALVTLFADGHLLLEGVPGLGKTLLVRTITPQRRVHVISDEACARRETREVAEHAGVAEFEWHLPCGRSTARELVDLPAEAGELAHEQFASRGETKGGQAGVVVARVRPWPFRHGREHDLRSGGIGRVS